MRSECQTPPLRDGLIPIVFVTAILPDGKPSGSISEAPFGG